MLTIYSETIGPRLSYVVEALFEDILGVSVLITSDESQLKLGSAILNYSHKELPDLNFIRPHSLLFEEGQRKLPETMDSKGVLFPTASDLVDQDIFAASFFLLSRYEEYFDTARDRHGRFQGVDSLMFKAGLLTQPLVDTWALELYDKLRTRYVDLPAPQRAFTMLPTFDIDVAYAFKGRGALRQLKTKAKDLSTLDFSRMKLRKAVLSGEAQDPYDSYEYQRTTCEQRGLDSRHFFLLGDNGPLDKNLSHDHAILQDLVRRTAVWSQVGIHPSMGSNERESRLKKEISRLQKILKEPVSRSRQHFLYLNLPETYQRLIDQGIKEDYTMGFADQIGFRAGTCSAFRWYNLNEEETTSLYLIPLSAMDSTLKDYLKLSPDEAEKALKTLKANVKSVKGLFVSLWHNHTVAEQGEWTGWRPVFEESITPS